MWPPHRASHGLSEWRTEVRPTSSLPTWAMRNVEGTQPSGPPRPLRRSSKRSKYEDHGSPSRRSRRKLRPSADSSVCAARAATSSPGASGGSRRVGRSPLLGAPRSLSSTANNGALLLHRLATDITKPNRDEAHLLVIGRLPDLLNNATRSPQGEADLDKRTREGWRSVRLLGSGGRAPQRRSVPALP
jgi:hypothetical protein